MYTKKSFNNKSTLPVNRIFDVQKYKSCRLFSKSYLQNSYMDFIINGLV